MHDRGSCETELREESWLAGGAEGDEFAAEEVDNVGEDDSADVGDVRESKIGDGGGADGEKTVVQFELMDGEINKAQTDEESDSAGQEKSGVGIPPTEVAAVESDAAVEFKVPGDGDHEGGINAVLDADIEDFATKHRHHQIDHNTAGTNESEQKELDHPGGKTPSLHGAVDFLLKCGFWRSCFICVIRRGRMQWIDPFGIG